MSRRRSSWSVVAIACTLVALVAGIGELFRLRFARGDVYPAYSSLRSDPLGTRVWYEALGAAGVAVTRNLEPPAQAAWGMGTIYVAGATWKWMGETDVEEVKPLLAAVEHGGRLVVALRAESQPSTRKRPRAAGHDGAPEDEGSEETTETEEPKVSLQQFLDLEREWLKGDFARDGGTAARVDPSGPAGLPDSLPWHAPVGLRSADTSWRVLYRVGDHAVVLERHSGAGSIVLMSDAFLLSNEAMQQAREPEFLAWLQGPGTAAVFDERHLGVAENTGVAALARRYGLEHAAIVLAAIALLFAWRSGSSLVAVEAGSDQIPPDRANELAGRDSAAGFVNLLRRTIPTKDLFDACLTEFRASRAWRNATPEVQAELKALGAGVEARDPVAASVRAHRLFERRL